MLSKYDKSIKEISGASLQKAKMDGWMDGWREGGREG